MGREMFRKCVVWGIGNYLIGNYWRIKDEINIEYLVDSNKDKWGKKHFGLYDCFSTEKLFEEKYDGLVIVAITNEYVAQSIYKKLEESNIHYITLCDAIKVCSREKELLQIKKYDEIYKDVQEPEELEKIVKFFSISVPEKGCNLKCPYCYLTQMGGYKVREMALVSPDFIRRAISRKRIGGTALLNFCGTGETLLCKELFEIVSALLDEGHYISIISNALLTDELARYTALPKEKRERLFFKCSFHYSQLVSLNLLGKYAENVKRLRDSDISISVELVPEDSIEEKIPEIMKFCQEEFGALPHLTVARDESKDGMPIITAHTEEEYYNLWSHFNSDMFDFKMKNRNHRLEYCLAGECSLLFSLENGLSISCPCGPHIDNIFEDITRPIRFRAVGTKCCGDYCINAHAYLTLGMIREINDYTYLQMRNRKCNNQWGEWITPRMANIMKQRICDNI